VRTIIFNDDGAANGNTLSWVANVDLNMVACGGTAAMFSLDEAFDDYSGFFNNVNPVSVTEKLMFDSGNFNGVNFQFPVSRNQVIYCRTSGQQGPTWLVVDP